MKVVVGTPPNFERLVQAFPMIRDEKRVIFTFGDTIYAPGGERVVTPALRAHEGVHYSRQTNDIAKIEAWWERYITDAEFRLAEEIPAHRAEWRRWSTDNRDRNARAKYLAALVWRLSGPLYANIITPREAQRRITA